MNLRTIIDRFKFARLGAQIHFETVTSGDGFPLTEHDQRFLDLVAVEPEDVPAGDRPAMHHGDARDLRSFLDYLADACPDFPVDRQAEALILRLDRRAAVPAA